MEVLKVEGLSKKFGGVLAVNDVSFTLQKGERLAIIGPNGAGKTTLFNMLNGQISPTAGRIYFFGQDITTIPTHCRAHLGQARSFQITSLLLNLTVLENVMVTLHGCKSSRFQMLRSVYHYKDYLKKVDEILRSVSLAEKRDELVKNISYGEQRKLELGICLASEPKLLLLDEPSNGLTIAESKEIINIIHKLGKDVTVLIVAHDMELVFGVADRIIVLYNGKLVANDTPENIRNDPFVKEIYMGLEEAAVNA